MNDNQFLRLCDKVDSMSDRIIRVEENTKNIVDDIKNIREQIEGTEKPPLETRISLLEEQSKWIGAILATIGIQILGFLVWGITHALQFLIK